MSGGEAMTAEESPEIIIVPFQDVGHVFPATELGRQLASRGQRVTLFLPSSSSSTSGPDDETLHPLIKVVSFVPAPPAPPPPPGAPRQRGPRRPRTTSSLEDYLLSRRRPEDYSGGGDAAGHATRILCAVVDVMMSGLVETCGQYGIPVVSFFTSSACSAAMELALARLRRSRAESGAPAQEMGSGTGLVALSGLPDDMALTQADLVRQRRARPLPPPPPHLVHEDSVEGNGDNNIHSQPPPPPTMSHHEPQDGRPEGPHEPPHHRGARPPRGMLGQTEGAIALAFNTCSDFEQPFLDYISSRAKKPVWGLGPLLPPQFWDAATAASPLVDADAARRRSSTPAPAASERDVLDWLSSKPRGSVLYVSFGSRVGPSEPEAAELAAALADSTRPFIWAMPLQPQGEVGWAEELATRAGTRGMVIRGWAPQLLILSHPSTGAFLSHCGWNSTVEALGCGVPVITWPVGGDQFYNAKLLTSRLKVGHPVSNGAADPEAQVTKDDITAAIEGLMEDDETRKRADSLRMVFARGFPECSDKSLDALVDFVVKSRL